MNKTLILGLGNSLLSDDAIGLKLVEKLAEEINQPGLEFKTSEKAGLNLIELVQGYGQLIIIDSVITGKYPPGTIIEYSPEDLPSNLRLRSPHDADFKTTIELAKKIGIKIPEKITILGIEVLDNLTIQEELTPQLSEKFPSLVEQIKEKIKSFVF